MGAPFIVTHCFQVQVPEKVILIYVIVMVAQVIAPVEADHFPEIIILTGLNGSSSGWITSTYGPRVAVSIFGLLPKAPARIYGAASVSSLYLPAREPAA